MKNKVFNIMMLILIMFQFTFVAYGKNDAPNSGYGDRYYVVNNTPPSKSNNPNLVLSIITVIVSGTSIFIVWYNVKKQINSVEKNINKQFELQAINNMREYIAELISEILKPDGGKLEDNEYVSMRHKELEIKVLSYLDYSNSIDKKLIDCITKFKGEVLLNKNTWIAEILSLENELITYKRQ
jgi:hypothetical protein